MDFERQDAFVACATGLMGPGPAEQRRARRRTNRMRHVCTFENHRLRSQTLKIGCVHAVGSGADNQVRAHFVWKKNEKIWFAREP